MRETALGPWLRGAALGNSWCAVPAPVPRVRRRAVVHLLRIRPDLLRLRRRTARPGTLLPCGSCRTVLRRQYPRIRGVLGTTGYPGIDRSGSGLRPAWAGRT